jgi:hypothetical protein
MSAIVLALGLTGIGAAPFIVQSASASVARAALDPAVEPCDAGQTCDPQTTVTVTTTLGTPTPDGEQPETTITKTVTKSPPATTKAPKPTKTAPPTTTAPPQTTAAQTFAPLPSQTTLAPVPSVTPTEQSVELPAVASDTPTSPPVTDTTPSSDSVQLEVHNAAPEFDQKSLTQKLSIPALVLVLLALFAVLIFEGRLRRMAHVAAVRKAGPQAARPDMPPGYPAGPGYATAGFPAPGYPGGTAYAPIISFVPVQTYPGGQPQYGPVHPDPYAPPQGYVPEPPPVVLHPDEFDSFNHEPPREYRDPFEPLVPPEPPPSDIPAGGATPYEDGPLGPASSAETGDSVPWEQEPPSVAPLFQPRQQQPQEGYEPPPYLGPDEDVTAVQPIPPQPESTREMPDPKHEKKRWGRK